MTDPTPQTPDQCALLQTLARSDPDFAAFSTHSGALAATALPDADAAGLAQAALAVLREDPDRAQRLDRLTRSPAPDRFDATGLGVPVLLAVGFLLRTHIRFRRHPDGRWDFQIEHKPGDTKLLTDLLRRIQALLPGTGPAGIDRPPPGRSPRLQPWMGKTKAEALDSREQRWPQR